MIIRRLCRGWTFAQATGQTETTTEIHDGVNQCPKCGSFKVLDNSMQTRSCDEAMTHFFHCTICKNNWKV